MRGIAGSDNMLDRAEKDEVQEILNRLDEYRLRQGLTKAQLAAELLIPYPTLKKWFYVSIHATRPAPATVKYLNSFLEKAEARQRTEIIRGLLLAIEDHLQWFQNVRRLDARKVFRETLDVFDVGYVTSLLTMLSEEETFKRWLQFNSYRFKGLRARPVESTGGRDGEGSKSTIW